VAVSIFRGEVSQVWKWVGYTEEVRDQEWRMENRISQSEPQMVQCGLGPWWTNGSIGPEKGNREMVGGFKCVRTGNSKKTLTSTMDRGK
jgi:hypothetical protein